MFIFSNFSSITPSTKKIITIFKASYDKNTTCESKKNLGNLEGKVEIVQRAANDNGKKEDIEKNVETSP